MSHRPDAADSNHLVNFLCRTMRVDVQAWQSDPRLTQRKAGTPPVSSLRDFAGSKPYPARLVRSLHTLHDFH